MPLFGSSSRTSSSEVDEKPARRASMFSRRRDADAEPSPTTNSTGLFSRRNDDASITAAHQKVRDAELAEKEADRALHSARLAVREARDHVKALEREATEDARRAKIKQSQAKAINKDAQGLGRHG